MDVSELSYHAIGAAKEAGADHAEAYVTITRSISVYIDDSRVKSVEEKHDTGLAMRVIKGGRVGQSSSSVSSSRQLEACARSAVRAASLLPEDEVFKGFAWPAKEQVRVRNRDKAIGSLSPPELSELAMQLVWAATKGKGVKVPNGVLRAADVESAVANTNELLARREASLVHLMATAMTGGASPGEGVGSFESPYLKNLDAEALGTSIRRRAMAASKAKAFKGRTTLQAIIPPHELAEMLQGSVSFALSAENVNRRRSPLAGKLDMPITSRLLTITDDPSDKRGMLSSPFDDEGVPTRKKVLVKDGVLRSFLYDLYNAHLSSTDSTGNGLRRSASEAVGNYQLPVGIAPVCLVVKPGGRGVEAMASEMDEGLVVEKVASADVHPITGDFGLEVRLGHLVKGGEVQGAVKHCLLSGNMFKAFGQVVEVGSDSTVSRNLIVPSVRFEGFELIGSD